MTSRGRLLFTTTSMAIIGFSARPLMISGCSSGFGLETAKYFLDRNWNVIATMRTPRGETPQESVAHFDLARGGTSSDDHQGQTHLWTI
jgi:NAD(P)-dependent dehydrogenase (short-subunit alcohol dehydrogenase family)